MSKIERLDISTIGELWVEYDDKGKYCYWEDLVDLAVKVSELVARVEAAHELHAVFTIKDSRELAEVKHIIADVFEKKGN
jgi:hypothetical protein